MRCCSCSIACAVVYCGDKSSRTPLAHAFAFVFTAIAIRDVPYYTFVLSGKDRLELVRMLGNSIACITAAASAWTLSRWTYNVSPMRSLNQWVNTLRRSINV
jgi:hypothetical protein